MHNKLLVADGAMAVAGGRNIADDYFQRGAQQNFVDLDALIVGPVVADLSAIFDRYWNSPVVLPIQAVSPSQESAAARQQRFDALTADAINPTALPEVDALGYGPVADDLDAGRLGLVWGHAMAIADPPDKRERDADKAWADSLAYQALMKIWTAEREVTITSPYLIPGPLGIAAFEALRQRQVKVTVLTNSLAATDEPLVHTGYARYRPRLVDAGIDLYELSPSRSQRNKRLGVFGSSVGRLHAKTAVVDGDKVYIGSMNLDPRSRTQNTELGVFIESPHLAREMLRVIHISQQQSAYQVQRAPGGGLQWRVTEGDGEQTLQSEPESSAWLKLHNLLFGLFVPEQLL
jgi:putative cardiolipin synthase